MYSTQFAGSLRSALKKRKGAHRSAAAGSGGGEGDGGGAIVSDPAAVAVSQGLAEIETIVGHAKAMGIKCEVVVAPGLVYHPDRFRGMVCTVVRRRKGVEKVVAAGGR